jgi:hypothetical protein
MFRKSLIRITLTFVAIVLLSSCIHVEPPHAGSVIDFETKKPIDSVVVNMNLGTSCFPGGGSFRDWAFETVTKANGSFSLPLNIKLSLPHEFFVTKELYFHKAGYFTARILDPKISNKIELHKVKNLSDWKKYQIDAANNMSLFFIDDHKNEAPMFLKEMRKIADSNIEVVRTIVPFSEIANAELVKIKCNDELFTTREFDDKYQTFAGRGISCTVYNKISKKWIGIRSQGQPLDILDMMPNSVDVLHDRDYMHFAYITDGTVKTYSYIKDTNHLFNINAIKLFKSKIAAFTGDWSAPLTVEDDGFLICKYSDGYLKKTCLSVVDLVGNHSNVKPSIMLSKHHDIGNSLYNVIIKSDAEYRIFSLVEINGNTRYFLRATEIARFESADNITGFYSKGNEIYMNFANTGFKRYTLTSNKLIEDIPFSSNISNLPLSNRIADFDFGPNSMLYFVVGEATVYRINVDGTPENTIKLQTNQ